MNKMNKKGFTLIEMLVVIAIIAVLVSIIIPVVGNSTTKAEAATDAANLRSAMATIQIMVLDGEIEKPTSGTGTWTAAASPLPANLISMASKYTDGGKLYYKVAPDGAVTVGFATAAPNADTDVKDLEFYQYIAEHGSEKTAG